MPDDARGAAPPVPGRGHATKVWRAAAGEVRLQPGRRATIRPPPAAVHAGGAPMLRSAPIIAFVATTDPERARGFYADTLGLRLVRQDAFALELDAGGTMLRVVTVRELHPAGYTVLGWIVQDVAASIRDLVDRGVVFNRYDGMQQDGDGVWTSPSGARIAWFADPDGNTLSLTQLS
jgi:catechol 2,3-dioxygenase-like lactoylglutathione lyase family enzyme